MIDGLQFEGAADSSKKGFFNKCVFKQRHGNFLGRSLSVTSFINTSYSICNDGHEVNKAKNLDSIESFFGDLQGRMSFFPIP